MDKKTLQIKYERQVKTSRDLAQQLDSAYEEVGRLQTEASAIEEQNGHLKDRIAEKDRQLHNAWESNRRMRMYDPSEDYQKMIDAMVKIKDEANTQSADGYPEDLFLEFQGKLQRIEDIAYKALVPERPTNLVLPMSHNVDVLQQQVQLMRIKLDEYKESVESAEQFARAQNYSLTSDQLSEIIGFLLHVEQDYPLRDLPAQPEEQAQAPDGLKVGDYVLVYGKARKEEDLWGVARLRERMSYDLSGLESWKIDVFQAYNNAPASFTSNYGDYPLQVSPNHVLPNYTPKINGTLMVGDRIVTPEEIQGVIDSLGKTIEELDNFKIRHSSL